MFACARKIIKVVLTASFFPIPLFSCSNPYISVIGFECHPNTPIFPVLAYLPFYQLKASGTSSQFFSFLLIWLSWVINKYEFSEPLHFRYGTQRNVVRQGCTSCIKINFINGGVIFGNSF